MTNYIIGAGGVGSWLVPLILRLAPSAGVVIFDGDKYEYKNMDRQLFDDTYLGTNKAEALADKYGPRCDWQGKYFSFGDITPNTVDVLLCCVDNDAARMAVLETADANDCHVIIGANEYTSAEARIYHPRWRGSPYDPRIITPSMATNKRGDPRAASIGCTGEAAVETPQLVSANFMAAAQMAWLYMNYFIWLPSQDKAITEELRGNLPKSYRQNLTKSETLK